MWWRGEVDRGGGGASGGEGRGVVERTEVKHRGMQHALFH